jgi:hypothetical protein
MVIQSHYQAYTLIVGAVALVTMTDPLKLAIAAAVLQKFI